MPWSASSSLESSRPKHACWQAGQRSAESRLKLAGIIKTEANPELESELASSPPQARWNHQDRSVPNLAQFSAQRAASSSLESSRPKRSDAACGATEDVPPQARWNHQDRSMDDPALLDFLDHRLKLAGIIKTEATYLVQFVMTVGAASSSLESSRPKRKQPQLYHEPGCPPQARWNHQDRSEAHRRSLSPPRPASSSLESSRPKPDSMQPRARRLRPASSSLESSRPKLLRHIVVFVGVVRLKLAGIIKTEAGGVLSMSRLGDTASSSLESSRPKLCGVHGVKIPLSRLKLAGIIKTEACWVMPRSLAVSRRLKLAGIIKTEALRCGNANR